MRHLPFVVQPKRKAELIKIGTEESGVFEIERRGYLTVTEKAAFQQVITSKDSRKAYRDTIESIAKEQKVKIEVVNDAVSNLLQGKKISDKESKMLDPYAEDLLQLIEVFKRETVHSQLVMATILLMSRVDSEWSFEDTAGLDMSIIDALSELYQAEEAKSMEALSFMAEATSPATEQSETEETASLGK